MELQGWDKLYQEIAEKIKTEIPGINWVDLWHNQVGFFVEEHPFPSPAVFLAFRILSVEDTAEKVQQLKIQVDQYFFYETFLDTFHNSYNQDDALDYLTTLTDLHKLFHGSSGVNYSEMQRVGLSAVDTGSAHNLYLQSFTCLVIDATALPNFTEVSPGDIDYAKGQEVEVPEEPLFKIPLTNS